MRSYQASKTAEYNAFFRAIESACPPKNRLFDDPLAQGFLSPSLRGVAVLARVSLLRSLITRYIDQRWPGSRPSVIARTRYIDDQLVQALQGGIDQVVVLGAGFDTRAYRLAGIEGARVFEVDYPSTSALKRRSLRRALGGLPKQVIFAEIDFNQQQLAEVLAAAEFEATRRAFFLWEGVTNYLTEQAVDATLRAVASTAPGSVLLFTYIHRGVLDGSFRVLGERQISGLLQRVSEPWTFGLDPATLPGYLEARGFQLLDDVGSLEYRARYMAPEGRHMRGYEFYRIARARVVGLAVSTKAGAVSARSATP